VEFNSISRRVAKSITLRNRQRWATEARARNDREDKVIFKAIHNYHAKCKCSSNTLGRPVANWGMLSRGAKFAADLNAQATCDTELRHHL